MTNLLLSKVLFRIPMEVIKRQGLYQETDEDGDADEGTDEDEDDVGLSSTDRVRGQLRDIINKCSIIDIVGDSKFHDIKTLVFFMELLIAGAEGRSFASFHEATRDGTAVDAAAHAAEAAKQLGVEDWAMTAGGGWPTLPLPTFAPGSSVLCERLLTEVTMCNRFRVSKVWPLLHQHFCFFLLKTEMPTFSVEAAMCGMLRLLIRLWSREALDGALTDTLALLLEVDAPKWDVLAPLLVERGGSAC